jgi:hypothetical protein
MEQSFSSQAWNVGLELGEEQVTRVAIEGAVNEFML